MKKYSIYICVILIFATSGCKVNYSFTGASIPIEAKTVSVSDFPNMAPLVNPLLSNTLREALRDKFMNQTSLQIVQYSGDLQFEGTITQYNTRPMNIQAGSDDAAQNRLTIGIKVKFINTIEPESSFETTFSQYSEYNSDQNFQDVENDLVDQITVKLVEDIFNKAVVNW
ncbi:MAG: LptE family protein [Salinivirgaceae bacterium]|jgi:hypothetical protein|nr:LptE family protein [Salinivirgaceae bacterium]